jgi:hypothetical protein
MLRLVFVLCAAFTLAGIACSDSTAPADAPANHTVNMNGQWHAPGLQSPQGGCTTCHGADLRGGTEGEPSCYACHGKKWN